ncbi:hypothetical protein M5K25_013541 [Dendrobium thyrsiflorum]|uniref:Uncharacterized protein n=1 Tax=Dendrobium thyrsiflorum TaxID=117978 RepID=A0ABD0UU43_DENTH
MGRSLIEARTWEKRRFDAVAELRYDFPQRIKMGTVATAWEAAGQQQRWPISWISFFYTFYNAFTSPLLPQHTAVGQLPSHLRHNLQHQETEEAKGVGFAVCFRRKQKELKFSASLRLVKRIFVRASPPCCRSKKSHYFEEAKGVGFSACFRRKQKELKFSASPRLVKRIFVRASPSCCRSKKSHYFVFNALPGGEAPGKEDTTNLCLIAGDDLHQSDEEEVCKLTYEQLFQISEKIHCSYRKLKNLKLEFLNLEKEHENFREEHCTIDSDYIKLLDEFDSLNAKHENLNYEHET